ncbi:MAG: UDP-N-acetylmuramoyl-L-alanyl-D-glutamate--2,6-diaminopimelate ligase [Caldilineales bacterium]|nr:UDP-N-acetylmuramoyl-L-alanyl-D-glutamate--2,6-diaminopimelate ligase [Caldilineales bacterium]
MGISILSLSSLAAALGLPAHQPDLAITQITSDSRQVRPGAIFVAYRGVNSDGHRFIPQAIAAGAAAVVGEQDLSLGAPYLRVENGRRALGLLCAAWEGFPSRRLGVIGVTGTDGKTTTSNLIHSILTAAGVEAGLLTTVNARIGDQTLDTGLHTTTPDAPDLHRYLRLMADAGSRWAVLETTSHGLSQWRVAGVDYDIAVVTNVTHEHMDEHGDYDGYLAAKARLVEMMAATSPKPGLPRGAVLNADDRSFAPLSAYPAPLRLSYGIQAGEVRATEIQQSPSGMGLIVRWGERRAVVVQTPLVGLFNVYNILAAVSTAFLLELDDAAIAAGVRALAGIPGRMERIDRGQDFTAIVDFAHTPFALAAALTTARELTAGRVIAVFGSAGLRDVAKRRMMGEVAGRLADLTVVTAEDPRTEDLEAIIAASLRACEEAGGRAMGEPDRYRAIQLALRQARAGDLVIVCGKGHEQSMCFGTTEHPWDDRVALRHALDVHLNQASDPPPLVLPTYRA